MLIWDTAGNEKFRKLAVTYYRNAAAAILAFDVTQESSINNLYYWLQELESNTSDRRIVIAIVACKCDLEPATGVEDEAKKLAASINAIYVETSSKENVGVNDVFKLVSERVLDWHNEYINSGNLVQMSIPVKVGGVVASVQRNRTISHTSKNKSISGSTISPRDGNTFQKSRTTTDIVSNRNMNNSNISTRTTPMRSPIQSSADKRLEIVRNARPEILDQNKQSPTLADTDSSEGSEDHIESSRKSYNDADPHSNPDINHLISSKTQTGKNHQGNTNVMCDGGFMSCGVPDERSCILM